MMDPRKLKSRIQTILILALVFAALYYFFAAIPIVSKSIKHFLPSVGRPKAAKAYRPRFESEESGRCRWRPAV